MNVHRSSETPRLLLAGAFLFFFAAFFFSPMRWLADSRHALLLTESLLRFHTAALESYFPAPMEPSSPGRAWNSVAGVQYTFGHLYYWFPPGGSFLAMPFVAVANVLGFHVIGPDGLYDGVMELALQRFLAAFLMAGLCALWLGMAGRRLSLAASILFACACAFSTPIWSTASRVLWSDTWGVLLLSVAMWMLVQPPRISRWQTPMLACLLAFMVLVKPTYAVSAVAMGVFWIGRKRGDGRSLALIASVPVLLMAAYSFANMGHILPAYFRIGRLHIGGIWHGLAGILFSPARGLLVYMPVLAWIAWLLVQHRAAIIDKPLLALALAVIAADIAVVACFPRWWGGQCFGPRLLVGTLPWLFLVSLLAMDAAGARAKSAAGLALVALGILLHGRAACSNAPSRWNLEPVNIDAQPSRLWDWRVPPFLADMVPDRLIPGAPLYMTSEGAAGFLGRGWSTFGSSLGMTLPVLRAAGVDASEDMMRHWRWTDGTDAVIRLHAVDLRRRQLTLTVVPYIVPGSVSQQRVEIFLNGNLVRKTRLTRCVPTRLQVDMPRNAGRFLSEVRLHLPDAACPKELGLGDDARRLGVLVLKIESK